MRLNDKIIKMSKTKSTEEIVDWVMRLKELEKQKGIIPKVRYFVKRNFTNMNISIMQWGNHLH